MSVKERLKIFAKSQERSIRAFEIKCGLNIGYINAIRVSIQPDKIKSIASHYPYLNIDWLLTGKGEMIYEKWPSPDHEDMCMFERQVNYGTCGNCDKKDKEIDKLNKLLDRQEKEIERKDKDIDRLEQQVENLKNELSMLRDGGLNKQTG